MVDRGRPGGERILYIDLCIVLDEKTSDLAIITTSYLLVICFYNNQCTGFFILASMCCHFPRTCKDTIELFIQLQYFC